VVPLWCGVRLQAFGSALCVPYLQAGLVGRMMIAIRSTLRKKAGEFLMDTGNFSFDDYMAWANRWVTMSLREQQAKFKRVLEPLHRVALVQSCLNDTRPSDPPKEPQALYEIGALAAQAALGMHAAVSTGAVWPAATIFRSLFELLVSMKLIREKDTQTRSKLYMNFDRVLYNGTMFRP